MCYKHARVGDNFHQITFSPFYSEHCFVRITCYSLQQCSIQPKNRDLVPVGITVTIHQVTTMLATSNNVLHVFPGHNHLLTTGTDDPSLWLLPECQRVSKSGNRTFLEVASMVVTRWIVFFFAWCILVIHGMYFPLLQTKCESYLPDRYGSYGGDIEVFVHSISEKDGFILRNITMKVKHHECVRWILKK